MNAIVSRGLAVLIIAAGCTRVVPSGPGAAPTAWCRPAEPCWPSPAEWQALGAQLTGKLVQPRAPGPSANPFALEDDPGATQSLGWLDAWTAMPSAYAVAAETPGDVSAAIKFAVAHHLRLAIKGTGHDYLGRSTAPDSLLVWTHEMRKIVVEDAFVPRGCAQPGVPAVSLGAGTRWGEAYHAVSVEHGRYVQGGGCVTVGAAGGFLQGGGFGSWSRKYGAAAASLLEAEVVTADGAVQIANACQNPDLFWALRGGGGGTFGVVTRVTLMTHPLPDAFGIANGRLVAASPEAYRALIQAFVAFYGGHLDNEHWGEKVFIDPDNALRIDMVFEGLSQADADLAWQPLRDWLAQHREIAGELAVRVVPAPAMWNVGIMQKFAPELIKLDDRPGASPDAFWWAGNTDEVQAYWYAYQSRWLPRALFDTPDRLSAALFEASRHHTVELHLAKGLAGAAPDAVARGKATAMNPAVYDAAALVIIAASADRASDRAAGERDRAAVTAAMAPIRAIAPDAGAYVNEADYFEPDWQHTFWGDNYPRLLAIKHRYDPTGLFVCHHCVGSE